MLIVVTVMRLEICSVKEILSVLRKPKVFMQSRVELNKKVEERVCKVTWDKTQRKMHL